MAERFTEGQIWVLVTIASLGGKVTVKEIESITHFSVQYIRNTLSELTSLGLITSVRGSIVRVGSTFGLLGKSVGRREALYILTEKFEGILEKHREIIEWSKIALNVDSVEGLEKKMEEIKKASHVAGVEQVNPREVLKVEGEETNITTKSGLTFTGVSTAELVEFLERIESEKKLKRGKDE